MNSLPRYFIEVTLVLILVFLVLSRSADFSRVIGSSVRGYTSAVRTLQGR